MKKELIENNIDNLRDNGIEIQIDVWIEELSELIKELCKVQRHYKKYHNWNIPFLLLNNVKLETTDVQVAIDQIKEFFEYSLPQQEMDYEFKVNRTREIIDKEMYEACQNAIEKIKNDR